jgi:uncharacterized GH25 family protein
MKKRSHSRRTALLGIFLMVTLIAPVAAHAHFPWINLTDYTPDQGAAMNLVIGWGHHYPLDGFLKKDALENIVLIGPEKDAPKIIYTSEVELQSEKSLSREGTYIVAAQRKAGFYTKTAYGGKSVSKKGLKDVIRCSYSHMCMKAVANVGKGGRADTIVGQPIEIIPLENPGNLRAGDYLPIRVVVDGKPFSGEVLATYVGFSAEKNTFAYATTTNKRGEARIKLLQSGVWLVKVSHEIPYANPEECDIQSYVGTLTFMVE